MEYKKPKAYTKVCDIPIKKLNSVDLTNTNFLGEIRMYEKGYSKNCNEDDAIEILLKEACQLDADFIIITDEERPNYVTYCFRCRADFYQFTGDNIEERKANMKTDYEASEVAIRVIENRRKNRIQFWSKFGIITTLIVISALTY